MFLLFNRRRLSAAKIFLIINFAIIIVVFWRGLYQNAYLPKFTNQDLAYYNGHNLTLVGRVCEEADVDYKSRRLTICIEEKIKGQILLSSKLYPIYDYGDFLKISGQLQTPPEIEGFDYDSYLARYDIYSVMYYPKIVSVSGRLSLLQKIYYYLIKLKQGIAMTINRSLPEPEAGLANALLLGYRRTIIRADLNIFSRVGLSHMIAISGSHITILSAMFLSFLLYIGLNRRQSLKIIFSFLFLYPLITGLAASALRASIMGFLAFLAIYYERLSSLIKALIFAAAWMLLSNPRLLRDDIGFQLSFLALLGIIYVYPLGETLANHYLEKLLMSVKVKNFVKNVLDTVNLTLVSQVVILPIALINFKQLSIIAPVANILVLWTFPLLLSSLIIGACLSLIFPPVSILFFTPSYLILKYIFVVSNYLASFSWSAVNIQGFTWFWGSVYYIFLVILVKILRKVYVY